MAQSIGNVVINLEANTAKLVDGFNRAERAVQKSTQEMKNNVVGLTTAYLSLSTAVDFSKYFMKQADAMTTVESRLRLVTKGADDLLQTQKALFQQAQSTRTNYVETADLYARIARSTKNYGIEQEKVLKLTDSISKAMTIGGGTAESQKAALMQLGQAFSANFKSVGQEFASIREQAPRVWQAMVEGAGVSEDVFRKMAENGQLSTEKLVVYFEKAKEKIDREFSQMTKTMSQGMMVISNSFKILIDTVNKETGLGDNLAEGFISFSKVMEDSIPSIVSFIKTMQESKEIIIGVGEALLVYKASSVLGDGFNAGMKIRNDFLKVQAERTRELADTQKIAMIAEEEARNRSIKSLALQKEAEIALQNARNASNGAMIVGSSGQAGTLKQLEDNAKATQKAYIEAEKLAASTQKVSKEMSAAAATYLATTQNLTAMGVAMDKLKTAGTALVNTFKAFAPTAALFFVTELFLNWEKITGTMLNNIEKSVDKIGKMGKYQLAEQARLAKNNITLLKEEVKSLEEKVKRQEELDAMVGGVKEGSRAEQLASETKALLETKRQDLEQNIELLNQYLQAQQNLAKSGNDRTQAEREEAEARERNLKGLGKTINETLDPLDAKLQAIKIKWDDIIAGLAKNQPINPTVEQAEQYKKTLEDVKKAREKEEAEARESFNKKDIKAMDDWAKKKADLAKELSILQQDELAKPYILLTAQYEEDMRNAKGNKEAQLYLTEIYNAKVQELNKDTVEKFNKQEEEKFKKQVEWQIKLFDANEKLNDQLISQREKMYGQDNTRIIEAWYQNQLEWLGKLSLEGKATSEELMELLNKIEELRDLKLKEQTLGFKIETSFYDSFEDNLADSIEDAFNGGGLNLKSFYRNISSNLAKTISGSLANTFTGGFRSSGSLLGGFGALATGSSVSASEISSIMNSGGVFNEATNSITTSGGSVIKLGADGSGTLSSGGSDLLSLANGISSLKTAYGVLTDGISGTITGGFNSVANLLGNYGFSSAGGMLSQFGAGFASPLSFATQSPLAGLYGSGIAAEIPTATMAGGMLSSGLIGYGIGSIGDKIFGANTKAGTYGAIGASIGSIVPGIGTLIGGAIGSVIGGMFGKKKTTDTGLQFFNGIDSTTTLSSDTIKAYEDWKKKSWFSSSKGTNYSDLTSTQMKQIEAVFDTYDYLLTQLGDSDKIFLEAGKYSGETFANALTKNFITAFTDVNQSTDDTIYQAWVKYAESVDSTVIEALSASINTFIATTRAFDVWALNRSGKGIEALAQQAQWAQEDFSNLSNMLGVTGVTVENYTQMYREAVKNSLTPETITQWQQLGTALQSATNAADTYKNSILSGLQQDLTAWIGALGSIQNAMDNLNPTFMTFAELASQTINLDNYSTLLSQLEKTRQNEIEKLTQSANERIKQLEDEKTLFLTISEFVDELTKKIIGYSVTTSSYFFSELANAKALISSGGTPDISSLRTSASSYLDKALGESTSKIEYLREVAKVREGIGGLGSLATGGSLEGIENAIKQEEETLASKLDEINKTALAILAGYKGTATGAIGGISNQISNVQTFDQTITAAYQNILGRTPESEGGAYWQSQLTSGNLSTSNITQAISSAAVDELYRTVLGREADAEGKAFWQSAVESGAINPTQLDEQFKEAAKVEINGSHSSGLDYVPFDGYIAELHKGERVQTASEVQKDSIINELQNSLKDLKDMFIKNIAETSRMSRVITRLDDNDALLVRVVV